MDNMVMALIGAAAACIAIGIVLFVSLKKAAKSDNQEEKKLLDEDYIENFTEAFKATGSIENTLEQLADIYKDNPHMSAFIKKAYDYITEYDGDYETALSMINVDNDAQVEEAHRNALNKFLSKKREKWNANPVESTAKEEKKEEKSAAFEDDEMDDFADEDDDDGFAALKAKAEATEDAADETDDEADDESKQLESTGDDDDDDEDLKI